MKLNLLLATSVALAALATPAVATETIKIINCGDGGSPEAAVQAAHIDEWLAMNEGFEVTVEYAPWGQCQEQSITLAAAGDPPAISYMGSRVLRQLADAQMIRPFELSDEELASYANSVLGTVQFDGAVWGLPRAFSTKALFWNKDLFAEAGLDMPDGPQTWDDVLTAARAVTENTDAQGIGIPAASFDNTMHGFLNWMYSNGGEVIGADGSVQFNSPQVVETLQFYSDLLPYMQDGPVAYDRAELEPLFRESQVAMYVNGGWGRDRVGDVDFGLVPIPAGPSGAQSTLLITDSLVVFEGTGLEEASASLVQYLTQTERQAVYDEAGGWTPIRETANSAALIEADPTWEVFISIIPAGGPEPSIVDYVAMQDVMNEAIQGVVLGEISPAEAAEEAADELERLVN